MDLDTPHLSDLHAAIREVNRIARATERQLQDARQAAMRLGRNVTANPERYSLYRLCECTACGGTGKVSYTERERWTETTGIRRCGDCRGEGRTRELIATCATPEAVGVALVTLGREGEWSDCPIGCLDTMGEPGEKWILKPWTPSARNISDAARTLRRARG